MDEYTKAVIDAEKSKENPGRGKHIPRDPLPKWMAEYQKRNNPRSLLGYRPRWLRTVGWKLIHWGAAINRRIGRLHPIGNGVQSLGCLVVGLPMFLKRKMKSNG